MPKRFQPRIRFHEGNALSRVRVVRGGGPNPSRSSLQDLTVPLLLRTQHKEDAVGASNEKRERDLWGVGTPEVFFWFQHSRPFKYLLLLRHMNPGGKLTSSPAYPVRGQCVEFGGGGGTSPFFCSEIKGEEHRSNPLDKRSPPASRSA